MGTRFWPSVTENEGSASELDMGLLALTQFASSGVFTQFVETIPRNWLLSSQRWLRVS